VTAKQQALLHKARRSAAAANRLLADGDTDFAASRTYYAMFYAAEAPMLSRQMTFKRHSAVISAPGENVIATEMLPREHHQNLIAAQYARNAGDCWTDAPLDLESVCKHIMNAGKFIEAVESLTRGQQSLDS
jgi:uncharacterized protein (UPF0332 family)